MKGMENSKSDDGNKMEERSTAVNHGEEIDVGGYFVVLRKEWWKIGLVSLGFGLLTLLLMFLIPNVYQATAVIAPPVEEKKQITALGALASFDIDVGGPSRVEDLESLFRSSDLTARIFRKHKLWPILFPDTFDPVTGKMRSAWTDRLFGEGKGARPPGDWDAIRAVKDRLKMSVNRKAGTLLISFESRSAEGSAQILSHYLEEGKSRLQEEAFERAEKNKKFIQEQIGKTVDALTRERLFSLYGQEVEREMMARNREQFGFRVIDTPRVPDRKLRPHRAKGAISATILSFIPACWFFLRRGRKKEPESTR